MTVDRLVRFVSAALLVWAVALTGCTTKQRGLNYIREEGDREYSRGNFDVALADYREHVQRNPGDAEVRHSLAKTLLKTGDPSAAVEHASIALDQKPDNERFLETLAESLYQSKQTDALYRLLRANASDRGRVGDYIRLGHYAAKLGDADGAEQALLFAAKLDGGKTVGPQLALADFYASINDTKGTLTRLRMALYIDPKNQEISDRIRALGEIPGPSLALEPAELHE